MGRTWVQKVSRNPLKHYIECSVEKSQVFVKKEERKSPESNTKERPIKNLKATPPIKVGLQMKRARKVDFAQSNFYIIVFFQLSKN